MQNFSVSPREMVGSLWRNRQLIRTLIQRDVLGRYRGSIMGVLWSFITPILMLAVYTFVFSVVFKARWSSESTSMSEFGMVLFVGLIVFNIFAECINKGPALILANVNYVKKVVFPLEVLPWVSLGVALFHAVVSVAVWLTAYVILFGVPHLTVLLLPIVVLPLLFLIMGLTWFLASLGVYLRDVTQFVAILTTVTMFLSPIFYPASALPERFQILLLLNPLTSVVEGGRDVLFWGVVPDLQFLAIYFVASLFIAWLGFAWFQKTRKGFADVL
ncbi:ABC transporter permease [Pseudomonas veronii]|jgi:lipopolysaccharide transport system permease protein|uniref:ABC transporter permease n=1 Tax=Pseudomonas veronii TaxID=76761 RepID=A0ABS0VP45_PSEVE|nr:ABC transporter permease [Pseudomonas veronii]MBI6553354.1 ABC transporter permease [Pseudomonas veronii]MBI6653260.1 ABC transporter permease [Pseudomonas veronii]WRU61038.1 ABC transporter permease [Pseudomonas veronii]